MSIWIESREIEQLEGVLAQGETLSGVTITCEACVGGGTGVGFGAREGVVAAVWHAGTAGQAALGAGLLNRGSKSVRLPSCFLTDESSKKANL